jgi:hypothetical protein
LKPFLVALLVAVCGAAVAELVLTDYAQKSAEMAYASSTSRP